jgi:hypothetical protein
VAHYLNRAYGVPLDRMYSVAHGEKQVKGSARKPPRRVEFEIIRPDY